MGHSQKFKKFKNMFKLFKKKLKVFQINKLLII